MEEPSKQKIVKEKFETLFIQQCQTAEFQPSLEMWTEELSLSRVGDHMLSGMW